MLVLSTYLGVGLMARLACCCKTSAGVARPEIQTCVC